MVAGLARHACSCFCCSYCSEPIASASVSPSGTWLLFWRDGDTSGKTAYKEADLFQQIGKLQMELEWLKKNLSCFDAHELRKLVDSDHPELSISRQCALLGLPRSTHYYRPTPVRASTLRIMARIDALYVEDPCSGSRRMVEYLAREGIPISRDRVRNLMRRMGVRAIY